MRKGFVSTSTFAKFARAVITTHTNSRQYQGDSLPFAYNVAVISEFVETLVPDPDAFTIKISSLYLYVFRTKTEIQDFGGLARALRLVSTTLPVTRVCKTRKFVD